MSKPQYDPVYLDKRVAAFLKTWPGDFSDAETYDRLVGAAVISTKRAELKKVPEPLLTRLGAAFLNHFRTRDFAGSNLTERFFPLTHVLACWPVDLLAKRFEATVNFLDLFGLDMNSQDVRRYISDAMDKGGRRPVMGFWEAIGDQPTRTHAVAPLEDQVEALKEALRENTYARQLWDFRFKHAAGILTDEDIPF